MSEDLKLGEIISKNRNLERDAVHIAVIPMTSVYDNLRPGQRIDANGSPSFSGAIGIVDPFLSVAVDKGDKFWCYLFPGTITSLRHHWTHPLLDQAEYSRETALKIMKKYADDLYEIDNSIEKLILCVTNYFNASENDKLELILRKKIDPLTFHALARR